MNLTNGLLIMSRFIDTIMPTLCFLSAILNLMVDNIPAMMGWMVAFIYSLLYMLEKK